MKADDTIDGYPKFYSSFDGEDPGSFQMDIKKAKFGCLCRNDPKIPCYF